MKEINIKRNVFDYSIEDENGKIFLTAHNSVKFGYDIYRFKDELGTEIANVLAYNSTLVAFRLAKNKLVYNNSIFKIYYENKKINISINDQILSVSVFQKNKLFTLFINNTKCGHIEMEHISYGIANFKLSCSNDELVNYFIFMHISSNDDWTTP